MPAWFSHFLCALPVEMVKVAGFARRKYCKYGGNPEIRNWQCRRLVRTLSSKMLTRWTYFGVCERMFEGSSLPIFVEVFEYSTVLRY
jgi:hypothetical protein